MFKSGNIKFVQRNAGSVAAPVETMTKRRVYVTVHPKYGPAYISYYDADNKRIKTIDLQHLHNGLMPHVHHGYAHNENDGPKGATGLMPQESQMVDNVLRVWYNKNSKQ